MNIFIGLGQLVTIAMGVWMLFGGGRKIAEALSGGKGEVDPHIWALVKGVGGLGFTFLFVFQDIVSGGNGLLGAIGKLAIALVNMFTKAVAGLG